MSAPELLGRAAATLRLLPASASGKRADAIHAARLALAAARTADNATSAKALTIAAYARRIAAKHKE